MITVQCQLKYWSDLEDLQSQGEVKYHGQLELVCNSVRSDSPKSVMDTILDLTTYRHS